MGDQHEASAGGSPRRGTAVVAPDHARVVQRGRAVGDCFDHLDGDLVFRSRREGEGDVAAGVHDTGVGATNREGLRA